MELVAEDKIDHVLRLARREPTLFRSLDTDPKRVLSSNPFDLSELEEQTLLDVITTPCLPACVYDAFTRQRTEWKLLRSEYNYRSEPQGDGTTNRQEDMPAAPLPRPMGLPSDAVVPIALIVAMTTRGAIGSNGDVPWYLPGDLKHFQELTDWKPIVMGSRTYAQFGEPLHRRATIVLSESKIESKGVHVAADLSQALAQANDFAERLGAPEIMIVGGGNVYQQTIGMASTIYLTLIDSAMEGGLRFPEIRTSDFKIVGRSGKLRGLLDSHFYEFITMERRF